MEGVSKSSPIITLSNPLIVSDVLKTTINYIIKTEFKSETHESTRTYEEFINLRKLLIQKWPGSYIPSIPNKTFLSNLNTKYIRTYKRQLEEFLIYTQSVDFIYQSEEFQCFLRSKSPFSMKFSSDLTEISLNHQAIFHDYIGRALNPELLSSIKQEEEQLQISHQTLVDMRDRSEVLSEDFKKLHTLMANTFNSFEKNEKFLITGEDAEDIYCFPDLTNVKNNFHEFFNWAENEILQIEALLEAIGFVWKLEKMQEALKTNVESFKLEIGKLENNQISFSKLFSFKSKDKFTKDKTFQIAKKENEIMNLRNFQTIIAIRLVEKEIPKFKENRFICFNGLREKYNEMVVKSMDTLKEAANKTLRRIARMKNP